MRLHRYLAVIVAGLAVDAAIWHLAVIRFGLTGAIGAAAGFAVALLIVSLSSLDKRSRYLAIVSLALASLLALALMARMPLLAPLAARGLAALAALVFSLFGFALYLRKG